MSPQFQTIAALVVVALALGWLIWRLVAKRGKSGCGSEGCSAVSPEIKKLQARLRR